MCGGGCLRLCRSQPDRRQHQRQLNQPRDAAYGKPPRFIKAEGPHQAQCRADKHEPANDTTGPTIEMRCTRIGHRNHAIVRRIWQTENGRHQRHTGQHQRDTGDDGGGQEGQHDLTQKKRPVEQQEHARTADHEGRDRHHCVEEARAKCREPPTRVGHRDRLHPVAIGTGQRAHQPV